MREEIKAFAKPMDDMPVFAVEMVGRSFCDETYHIYRGVSEITVIEYVEQGTGTVLENGHSYTASAGCVYLLHVGREHEYFSDAKDPWIKKWCNLCGVLPKQLLDGYGLGNVVMIPNCGEHISALFDRLLEICAEGSSNEEIFSACALCFHELVIALSKNLGTGRTRDAALAQSVRRMIDTSIETELSIDRMCSALGVSRSKLFTCFREFYGTAPYEYFQNVRLEAIKRLLRQTFLPISEISEQFHFADAHYFSGWFKKHTGRSPVQYRKEKMQK